MLFQEDRGLSCQRVATNFLSFLSGKEEHKRYVCLRLPCARPIKKLLTEVHLVAAPFLEIKQNFFPVHLRLLRPQRHPPHLPPALLLAAAEPRHRPGPLPQRPLSGQRQQDGEGFIFILNLGS